MSYLVASIVASTAGQAFSGKRKGEAQKEADAISKYYDLIEIEEQAQANNITKYNETRALASGESGQIAVSAGQGKRGNSASLLNMQSIAREDMELNFERMDDSIETSRDMAKLSDSARQSATESAGETRKLNLATSVVRSGLLLTGKK